ncbi:hypothetical protein NS14008_23090 [Nocardia seriolae]|nr:hypothetical protein NS14008_23090 [Nocardia seriolae]
MPGQLEQLPALGGDLHPHRRVMRRQVQGVTQERDQLACAAVLGQGPITGFHDQPRIQRREPALARFESLHQLDDIPVGEGVQVTVQDGVGQGFDCGHQFGDAAVVESETLRTHELILPLIAWAMKVN